MKLRASLLLLLASTLIVPALLAQDTSQAIPVAPPVVRPVQAPSANASADQLEATGDHLKMTKAYLDALDYYNAAVKKAAPGEPTARVLNKIGITQMQMAHFDAAKKTFHRAIKVDNKYPEAYNNLGVVFYYHKKYGGAIKNYKKAIALNDQAASFHSNLGTAYFARKDFTNSILEYQRALRLDPEVFERHSSFGIAAQMLSPEDRAHYSYVLAKMYAQEGEFDKSLQYLRRAMEDGYTAIGDVYKDNEFSELRKDKRFVALMADKPVAIPVQQQ